MTKTPYAIFNSFIRISMAMTLSISAGLFTQTTYGQNSLASSQSSSFETLSESIESISLISKVDDSIHHDDTIVSKNKNNSNNLIYNILIKTDKSVYFFAVSPDVAVHLPYPDYNKKEDFTQWYNSVQYHEPIMSDIEILSDKKTVHAQLLYYPHLDNHEDLQTITIYGQRIDAKVMGESDDEASYDSQAQDNSTNDAKNTHNTHASVDVTENAKAVHYNIQAFTMGFDSNWNTNDMNLKIDDNEKEIAYKKWHDPVKHLEESVHNTTQNIISPFGLLFCTKSCMPGG